MKLIIMLMINNKKKIMNKEKLYDPVNTGSFRMMFGFKMPLGYKLNKNYKYERKRKGSNGL